MAMPPPYRQQLSRQQRRRMRRDALERGRKLLQRGLGADLGEDEATGIALVIHERLTDTTRPRRAAEAAEIVETLLDASMKADIAGHQLGCHKGCSFCCSALVTCTAPEIFRVAHWLKANPAVIDLAGIAHEATRRGSLPATERFLNRSPCPMLVSKACGIYEVRPLPCRALLSLSSEACRLAMEEGKGEVPLIAPAMSKSEMARTLLLAAVSAAGLSDRGIELNAGVTLALGMPDAEARWLAGENIFADVLGADRSPASRRTQDHIASIVRALDDKGQTP